MSKSVDQETETVIDQREVAVETDITGEFDLAAEGEDLDEEEIEEEEEERFVSIFEILDAPRDLPEPIDLTTEHIKQIQHELGIITLCWPDVEDPKFENRVNFPESYVRNSNKEKLVLLYAENFRRQFSRLYPNRTPLFLARRNEVGLVKMVCTTIRPTTLPHPEVDKWQDLALFIGDQLKYEPLETPTLLPDRLYSPHTVVLRQSGHCFEFATVLCSLLIGQGYDAYVVSGYATQDICSRIMTRVDSPFPPEEEEVEQETKTVTSGKYVLKPPKDLRSKFLLAMAQREIDKEIAEKQRLEELEKERLAEIEKPPPDELYGLRLHSWVLLLPNAKYEENGTFIEPSTGLAHSLSSKLYCGIESVWNHNNYWVNLQHCSDGLENMEYNFYDLNKWEHFLIGEPLKWREPLLSKDMEEDEIHLLTTMDEKHLDMPVSWSLCISIPHSILKQRFPQGKKVTWYKRTKVEQFAPYVQIDGLVTRISRYNDLECSSSELHTTDERYLNRVDKLVKVITDVKTSWLTEYFDRGREDAVKKHIYKYGDNSSVESERIIEFYHKARYDALQKLELNDVYLTEHYIDREDNLFYRHSSFSKRGDPPPGVIEGPRRIGLNIVEKFNRNEKIPASKDISVREFNIIDREIHIKYHYEEGKVTASTRNFIKPSLAEMGDGLRFDPNLTVGYQAEVGAKPPRQLQLFLLLEQLLKDEEETLYLIRELEDQTGEFLRLRNTEYAFPKLSVSLFDMENNIEAIQGFREREQKEKEHKEHEVEDEIDYLEPYIYRMGSPSKLNYEQAAHIRGLCYAEFKQMLVDRANDIQQQFEQKTALRLDKQAWYLTVEDTLNVDDETQYFNEINDLSFHLHTLEVRLARHRDLSPYRFEALNALIETDPRLKILYK